MTIAALIALAVTLGSDNIGANIRQRIPVVIVASIAAVVAYGGSNKRKSYEQ